MRVTMSAARVGTRGSVLWLLSAVLLASGGPNAGAQRRPANVGPEWAVVEEYLEQDHPDASRDIAAALATL